MTQKWSFLPQKWPFLGSKSTPLKPPFWSFFHNLQNRPFLPYTYIPTIQLTPRISKWPLKGVILRFWGLRGPPEVPYITPKTTNFFSKTPNVESIYFSTKNTADHRSSGFWSFFNLLFHPFLTSFPIFNKTTIFPIYIFKPNIPTLHNLQKRPKKCQNDHFLGPLIFKTLKMIKK